MNGSRWKTGSVPAMFMLACALLAALYGCSPMRPGKFSSTPSRIDIPMGPGSGFDGFVFREEFSAILTNLINTSWDESGDWKGDLQGDATAFAPMLLYPLAYDTGDNRLRDMADRTVAYEAGLVKRCLFRPDLSMNMVIGFPALVQPYLHADDDRYLPWFFRGVSLGYAFVRISPAFFTPFVKDRASVYGLMGYMSFIASEATDDAEQKNAFTGKGVALIEKANEKCWDASNSRYEYTVLMDWSQETMMMALIKAYRATGKTAYLERVIAVLDSMDRCCLDTQCGGYSGHPDSDAKALSGNNNMAWVLLDLYEATGQEMYLQRAGAVLAWILSKDLYDQSAHVIRHHYTKKKGRADYHCTGCNFHTLVCLYRYNDLLGNHTRISVW